MIKTRANTQLMPYRVHNTFDETPLTQLCPQPLADCQLTVDHLIATMNEETLQDIMNIIAAHQSNREPLTGDLEIHTTEDMAHINGIAHELELDSLDIIHSQQTQSPDPDLSELLNDNDNNLMVDPVLLSAKRVPAQTPAQSEAKPLITSVTQDFHLAHISVPSPESLTQSQDNLLLAAQQSSLSSMSHRLGEISLRSPSSQPDSHSPDTMVSQTSQWPLSPVHYPPSARPRSVSDCLLGPNRVSLTVDPLIASNSRSCRPSQPYHRSNTDPMPSTSSQALPHYEDAFPGFPLAPIANSSQSSLYEWPNTSATKSTISLSMANSPAVTQLSFDRRIRTTSEPILNQPAHQHRFSLEQPYPVMPYRREGQTRRGRPSTRTRVNQQTPRKKLELLESEAILQEQRNYCLKRDLSALIGEVNHIKHKFESIGIDLNNVRYPDGRPLSYSRVGKEWE